MNSTSTSAKFINVGILEFRGNYPCEGLRKSEPGTATVEIVNFGSLDGIPSNLPTLLPENSDKILRPGEPLSSPQSASDRSSFFIW